MNVKIVFLTALTASLVLGCDEGMKNIETGESPASIVDNDGVTSEKTEEDFPQPNTATEWLRFSQKDQKTLDQIQLRVTNLKDVPLSAKVVFSFSGLDRMEAKHEFDAVLLDAGESHVFALPAKEVPLQSTYGINQLFAWVYTSVDDKATTASAPQATQEFFYVNSPDGNNIKVFNQEILLSKYNGKIMPVRGTKKHDGPIGKIKTQDGSFRALTWDDMPSSEAAVQKNSDKPFLGQLVGIEIEITSDEDEKLLEVTDQFGKGE